MKEEIKHTPGPWKLEKWGGVKNRSLFKGNLSVMAGHLSIAMVQSDSDKPVEANAHLISASPDLLEALEDILAITNKNHVAWEKARAAIAKAKGENV